jgi:hypothetical protein
VAETPSAASGFNTFQEKLASGAATYRSSAVCAVARACGC